jgi:hypothetical protein
MYKSFTGVKLSAMPAPGLIVVEALFYKSATRGMGKRNKNHRVSGALTMFG